ncbi:MAG: hypothetical protein Udaeo2_12710 [Candidatus Udaeobacter sp.]|nr:MAG: hypothetical protein Udaeo2_12710 [Candidatus Udaeobacter sp.]
MSTCVPRRGMRGLEFHASRLGASEPVPVVTLRMLWPGSKQIGPRSGQPGQMLGDRTLCRLLKTAPSMVPAEPRTSLCGWGRLPRLGRLSRRWNNIVAWFRRRTYRRGRAAGGARRPLSFPWEVLRAAIPDNMPLWALVHQLRSAGGIAEAVDTVVSSASRAALMTEARSSSHRSIGRPACSE